MRSTIEISNRSLSKAFTYDFGRLVRRYEILMGHIAYEMIPIAKPGELAEAFSILHLSH
ncbi:hypothetical protein [Sinorhizobium meliloti]|uniref:hypothetical protein n=1 Tax=Rhizobium meliloti TaxID=382 RepID=UPI0020911910|nr:hypothetical protein [Sinorhizobium meliloti]MCO5964843.1 hypothetical protein [Sinorhizobium meliloti]